MNLKGQYSISRQSRRIFLGQLSAAAVGGIAASLRGAEASRAAKTYRAAVIGHTGQGDYGHGLDLVFNDRPDMQVVAVADPDAAGRARAAERCRAPRQYADYREMLAQERPEIVSVGPRWSEGHHALVKAALEAGAHVYCEKPFTESLEQADDLLQLAQAKQRRIAVAHQMRLAPSVLALKARMADGLIGDLLEVRAHGKQDTRAGGEDLIVLGIHLFDLMRFFAGDPAWCTARILQQGREVTRADIRRASERIGPVLGDNIFAQFGFPQGVNGSFSSRGPYRTVAGHWGIEFVGSQGRARLLADIVPAVLVSAGDAAKATWTPMEVPGAPGSAGGVGGANQRVLDDLLAAVREGREPACSGAAAARAYELAMGIFAAGLSQQRVTFPLQQRAHPLASAQK